MACSLQFQSTFSARRTTRQRADRRRKSYISIHVLREEDDLSSGASISSHSLFQSTSSARRTTQLMPRQLQRERISIHVLREEDDSPRAYPRPPQSHFNPRPPRGGRHESVEGGAVLFLFQSTSSARRTTNGIQEPDAEDMISIHVLREEDDRADCTH